MAGGKFLRPESRGAGRKRRRRLLRAWAWLALGNAALLAAQILDCAHPVFAGLLMAALSARAGYAMGLER